MLFKSPQKVSPPPPNNVDGEYNNLRCSRLLKINIARGGMHSVKSVWFLNVLCMCPNWRHLSRIVDLNFSTEDNRGGGGGGVLRISSDGDDQMGAKIKTQKNTYM